MEDNHHNSNHPRTKGAIFMGPSVNIQGGFKFMILRPIKNITERFGDIILTPDKVFIGSVYQENIKR